mmetsp:Transcript_9009/g.26162  ORF Transcript_9009/g.26162 Transcript_9009/m.26162 type:complete len:224 (+) Transcript_9009:391-1062(+)
MSVAACSSAQCGGTLHCGNIRVMNGLHISARASKSIYVRHTSSSSGKMRVNFARNGTMVEVEHEHAIPFPEGVVFGCWSYIAVGSGIFVNAGATLVLSRPDEARRHHNFVADGVMPDGSPGPLVPAGQRFRRHLEHVCVWVPPRGPRSGAPLVALAGVVPRQTSNFPLERARAFCLQVPGVARAAQLLDAGPLGLGNAALDPRTNRSAAGKLALLPALDGMLA